MVVIDVIDVLFCLLNDFIVFTVLLLCIDFSLCCEKGLWPWKTLGINQKK